ncbi:MAG: AMP-binding protein [Clostridiales bacterium]|jgi:long-subunit acyl-CoA synthetase (AMP-forming)|nr:AMP-binding protein [Clostridiales bacterium]
MELSNILLNAYEKWGERPYIFSRLSGSFISKSFGDIVIDTLALSEALLGMGLKGKKIIVYGENSYEWMVADLAIMGFVGVAVAINKEWGSYDLENTLNYMDISAIIYSGAKTQVINEIRHRHSSLIYIPMQPGFPGLLANKPNDVMPLKNLAAGGTDKTCKIIFTSGTTSEPKAVMLSQKNIFAGWNSLYRRAALGPTDICYLFLPLSHTYGGIFNFLYSLIGGWQIYLCSDNSKIAEELKIVKPTIFSGVPLIYENFYTAINGKHSTKLKTLLAISNPLRKIGIDARKVFFKSAHNFFGGNIKYMFSGGAYFKTNIRKFYKDIGFNMMEAYALSETASSLSIEYSNCPGLKSAGTIFEDIEVQIINKDENGHGEIIVKGDCVTSGYYAGASPESFDSSGFFHTGDIGYKDNKNNLYLTGRKKRVLIGPNGENIYPDEISGLIMKNPGVSRVKVYLAGGRLAATVYLADEKIDLDSIIKKVNGLLPPFKHILVYKKELEANFTRLK